MSSRCRCLLRAATCLALALVPAAGLAQNPPTAARAAPDLRALDEVMAYLVGDWVEEPGEIAGEPVRRFSFERVLEGHAVVRRSRTEDAATTARAVRVHEDLMLMYAEGAQLRALSADSDGQVLHYVVAYVHGTGVVTFESQLAPGRPRYRLTYTPLGAVRVGVAIEIALPEAPATFRPYRKAVARRAK